jgi:hypothetical protein
VLSTGKLAGGGRELRLAVCDFQLTGSELLLELDQFPFTDIEYNTVLGELLFAGLQFVLSAGKLTG